MFVRDFRFGEINLLNIMAGLDKPTRGNIKIKDINIENLTEKQITKFRRLNVGFVFQSYNLINNPNTTENVSLGLIFKGIEKIKEKRSPLKF